MTTGNVYQRIAAAYKELSTETFEKTGKVTGSGGGYNFIPIGQILEVVRKVNGNNGVIVVFGRPKYDADQGEYRTKFEKTSTDQYGNKKTTTWHYAVGHIDVKIFGESDNDCIETEVPFEVQDNSDKLTNKIITNAERCLYRTLYSIDEGGEDPESINEKNDDVVQDKPQKASPSKNVQSDPFFSGGAKPKAAAVPDELTEAEIDNYLNVKGATSDYKDMVKTYKINNNVKTVYDLPAEVKIELYNIIRSMEGIA